MLATIAAILLIFWILGFSFHVLGSFVHIILVIALVLFIIHFLRGSIV